MIMVNEMNLTVNELDKEYSKQELYNLMEVKRACTILQEKGVKDRYKIVATYTNAEIYFGSKSGDFRKGKLCGKSGNGLAICTSDKKDSIFVVDNVIVVKEI